MIYLIYGEEQYLIKQELLRIVKKYPNAAVEKFVSPSFDSLIETISIPSLFSPERILVVEDLDMSQDSEKFIACISSLPQGVVLAIKTPQGLDKRSKIFKTIDSLGEVHEFKAIPEWEEDRIADFVKREFKNLGKEVGQDEAYILVEGVGRDLSLIKSEIEKIVTYSGNKTTIDKQDIEAVMAKGGHDSFSLAQAVLKRDGKAALILLERLLSEKEDPVQLTALISSQHRMLFKVKLLAGQNMQPPQISRRLKASPYYINRLYDASKKFKLSELKSGLEALYNADLKLKSGFNQNTELTLLISDLTQNA